MRRWRAAALAFAISVAVFGAPNDAPASLVGPTGKSPDQRLGKEILNDTAERNEEAIRLQIADWGIAADGGDAEAAYHLGLCYDFGVGPIASDRKTAERWYRLAVDGGQHPARHNLALLLLGEIDSLDDRPRFDEALSLLAAAAEGLPESSMMLGMLHRDGNRWLAADPGKALEWFRKSAASGGMAARFEAGRLLGTKSLYPDLYQPAEALAQFEAAAAADHVPSHNELARRYLFGDGVDQDLGRAHEHFTAASELGDGAATFHLGELAEQGLVGGKPDLAAAATFYEKAAETGYPDALAAVGRFILAGQIGEAEASEGQRFNRAREWLQRAASAGSQTAHLLMGEIFERGLFEEKVDVIKAHQHYLQAALRNNAEAQSRLGMMYTRGDSLPVDPVAALTWFQRAARGGSLNANFNLGRSFETGYGVPADIEKAIAFYRVAAERGHAAAAFQLGKILAARSLMGEADTSDVCVYFAIAAKGGFEEAETLMQQTLSQLPLAERAAVQARLDALVFATPDSAVGEEASADDAAAGDEDPASPVDGGAPAAGASAE